METVTLPLLTNAYTGVKKSVLTDRSFKKINWVTTLNDTVITRPTIHAIRFLEDRTKFFGAYYWRGKNFFVAVAADPNGFNEVRVYLFDTSGNKLDDQWVSSWSVDESTKTSFAEDGDSCYIAQGKRILRLTIDPLTGDSFIATVINTANAPANCLSVMYIDGYLLSVDQGNTFRFSNILAPTTWSALDFASALGSNDLNIWGEVIERELYIFGQSSVEIWQNDGTTPFSRIPGGYLEVGALSSNLIVKDTTNTFYFIDTDRRVVMLRGRDFKEVPCPFAADLQKIAGASNGSAWTASIAGVELIGFNFFSDGVTYVYNPKTQAWDTWGEWSPEGQDYKAFRGMGLTRLGNNPRIYCGGTYYAGEIKDDPFNYPQASMLYELKQGLGYDTLITVGTPIAFASYYGETPVRPTIESGALDFGTKKLKRSHEIRITIHCDQQNTDAEIEVSFKSDGYPWTTPRKYSLVGIKEGNVIRIKRTGIFRSRQYRITVLGKAYVEIARIEEDVEVLGR